jgi:hypothetical protein
MFREEIEKICTRSGTTTHLLPCTYIHTIHTYWKDCGQPDRHIQRLAFGRSFHPRTHNVTFPCLPPSFHCIYCDETDKARKTSFTPPSSIVLPFIPFFHPSIIMFQAVRTIARRQQQQHHQLQQRLSPLPGWGRAVESTATPTTTTRRTYLSRAHPTKLPEYPVLAALDMVLGETQARAAKRADKWERNKPVRVKKGMEVRGVG